MCIRDRVMSPVHQVWPKPSCKAQWKGEEHKSDRGRSGKTTSRNGQAWSSAGPRGQWRRGKKGENWLWNHLWCPTDLRGKEIDDDDDDDDDYDDDGDDRVIVTYNNVLLTLMLFHSLDWTRWIQGGLTVTWIHIKKGLPQVTPRSPQRKECFARSYWLFNAG